MNKKYEVIQLTPENIEALKRIPDDNIVITDCWCYNDIKYLRQEDEWGDNDDGSHYWPDGDPHCLHIKGDFTRYDYRKMNEENPIPEEFRLSEEELDDYNIGCYFSNMWRGNQLECAYKCEKLFTNKLYSKEEFSICDHDFINQYVCIEPNEKVLLGFYVFYNDNEKFE